jgi:hypothetical protein
VEAVETEEKIANGVRRRMFIKRSLHYSPYLKKSPYHHDCEGDNEDADSFTARWIITYLNARFEHYVERFYAVVTKMC